MSKIRLLQLCFIFVSLSLHAHSEECTNYSNLFKTRTFEDLDDFQHNNKSFLHGDVGYEGNNINFNDDNMTILRKNAFVTYDSANIRKMSLDGKQINVLEDGAFYTLDCLSTLVLRNNSIAEIRKWVFIGLNFLRELDLSENLLEEVPERAFTFLSRLRALTLARNKLRMLTPDTFFKLWLLQYLDLSDNCLKSVPVESLQYFRNLRELQLGSNRIEDLRLERWRSGQNLAILNVSDNGLEDFDLSIKCSFRMSLMRLYLGNNYIRNLFLASITWRYPYLTVIDINDNFWTCRELLQTIQALHAASIIVYPGNTETVPNINRIACDRPQVYKWSRTRESGRRQIATGNVTNSTTGYVGAPIFRRGINTTEAVLIGFVFMTLGYVCVHWTLTTRCFLWLRHRGYSRIGNSTHLSE